MDRHFLKKFIRHFVASMSLVGYGASSSSSSSSSDRDVGPGPAQNTSAQPAPIYNGAFIVPDLAWHEYQTPEGNSYYYNTLTQETTWERPEDVPIESHVVDRAAFPVPVKTDVKRRLELEPQGEAKRVKVDEAQPAGEAPAVPADAEPVEFWYKDDEGQERGPYPLAYVAAWLESGHFSPATELRRKGGAWAELRAHAELQPVLEWVWANPDDPAKLDAEAKRAWAALGGEQRGAYNATTMNPDVSYQLAARDDLLLAPTAAAALEAAAAFEEERRVALRGQQRAAALEWQAFRAQQKATEQLTGRWGYRTKVWRNDDGTGPRH